MYDLTFCPQFHRAVELVGRRWTGVIVRAMMGGAIRFSDISAAIPGLSDRLLSERLKELESEGIVRRSVFAETPVRIEYRLTEKGQALDNTIAALADWAEHWGAPVGAVACEGSASCDGADVDGDPADPELSAAGTASPTRLAVSLRQ